MREVKDLTIIDAHCHIFPQKIAMKATQSIGDFYSIPMRYEGFPHVLVESGRRIGVKKYLVCSTATKPEQVESINDFIYEKCKKYPEFFGFGTLHQHTPDYEAEIERIKSYGLHGIKLHPDFQRFHIDDPKMIPVYRAIAREKLPVLFHMGDAHFDYSAPRRLANVMQQVPDLIAVAAHFGGYNEWDEADKWLKIPNVYYDTSSSLFALSKEKALKMIDHFGVEKFFFGTDFPMWDHVEELNRFLALGLSEEENDMILYKNFERLFGITV